MFTSYGFGQQIVVINQMDTLFCNLRPKAIKPPTLGQTLLLYLDSHRVRGSWYPILNVIGIQNQYKSSCLLIFFDWITFSFWLGKRYRSLGLLRHVLSLRLPRNRQSQSNPLQKPHLIFWYRQCQQNCALIRNQAAWESDDLWRKFGNLKSMPLNTDIPTMYVINTKTQCQFK